MLLAGLKRRGILAGNVGPHAIRLVTHHDVDRSQCETAARAFGEEITVVRSMWLMDATRAIERPMLDKKARSLCKMQDGFLVLRIHTIVIWHSWSFRRRFP